MKKKTFAETRVMLLDTLRHEGWLVIDNPKVPYATSPDGTTRLWFKAQSLYGNDFGRPLKIQNAHSWTSDIRQFSDGKEFVSWVHRMIALGVKEIQEE
jgi:hypothetical protein